MVGYELLFRSSQHNRADFIDGDSASSHVLLYAFGEHRINDVIGEKKPLLISPATFCSATPPLPPEQLVIEILEDILRQITAGRTQREKKNRGYEFALDDFVLNKDSNALLPFASTIKVDVLNQRGGYQAHHSRRQTLLHPPAGRKIETHAMFKQCVGLGFEWFQGYFYQNLKLLKASKPRAICKPYCNCSPP